MVCVVVTRGGAGDLWRHRALQEAADHPITQLGDALILSPEDVLAAFTVREMATLAGRLGNPQLEKAASAWTERPDRASCEHYAQQLWDSMRKLSAPAPTDDSEIVRVIRADRRAVRSAGGGAYRLSPEERLSIRQSPHQRERSPLRKSREAVMSDENTEKKTPIRTAKYSNDSVVSFGKDKEGNSYGPENNPKKAGSKAHASFANYREGETVKDLLERGGTTRNDVNFDVDKGYIVLS